MTKHPESNASGQAQSGVSFFAGHLAFILGFVGGSSAATAYLLADGSYLLAVPKWASIAFYPGFLAGFNFYEYVNHNILAAQAVGCCAVGVTYGAAAQSICLLLTSFKK